MLVSQIKAVLQKVPQDSSQPSNALYEELVTLRAQLCEHLAEARRALCVKKAQYLLPKDKEYTDLDRTIRLEAEVADLQKEYDILLGFRDIIDDHIKILWRPTL